MRCERLPDCAAGQWTLWMRHYPRPDRWRYLDCGSVTYLEDLLPRCGLGGGALRGDGAAAAGGIAGRESREECHRRRKWWEMT